jgi:hypothetical protein
MMTPFHIEVLCHGMEVVGFYHVRVLCAKKCKHVTEAFSPGNKVQCRRKESVSKLVVGPISG